MLITGSSGSLQAERGGSGTVPLLGVDNLGSPRPRAVELVAGEEQNRSGFLISIHQMAPAVAQQLGSLRWEGWCSPGGVWQEGRGQSCK